MGHVILFPFPCVYDKGRLKIPKGQSESVNRRRTYNTMAITKGQRDKQQFTSQTHKIKYRVTRTQLKTSG